MQKTTYQKPELRDANDNIIQQGAFGKNTALCTATNDGWIDYVANDLEFLYALAKDEVVPVPSLPSSGQMNKTYLLTTTGVSYRWSGTEWVAVSSSEAVGRAESAANLAEQWATKTDGTVDGTEYSAKYYAQQAQQSADDAQDVADDMETHLVQIDKNTGGVAKNSKRISNIEKLLQGNLYDYDTDDDVAYVKDAPSGALPYAGVEKLGGKTLVWNQLVDTSATITDSAYVSHTLTDGVLTVTPISNVTAVKTATLVSDNDLVQGHVYLGIADVMVDNADYWGGVMISQSIGSSALTNETYYRSTSTSGYTKAYILGKLSYASVGFAVRIANNTPNGVECKAKNIQLFDLTLMFGAGNEPSTVAEFEAMFPADYYEYNAGELLSAGVTEVVSKDSNNVTLQTYSIPTAIRNIEGYGWSAGTAYNYIDFERKVFVQNVGRADLGTQSWSYSSQYSGIFTANFGYPDSTKNMINNPSGITCPRYAFKGVYSSLTDMSCGYIYYKNIAVKDDSFNGDTAAFKTAMSGVYAYYPLATPIETDISAYLTDDNLIEVESGGTLTFENVNGDDYHIPVPSEVTYMIDLQEAISNG